MDLCASGAVVGGAGVAHVSYAIGPSVIYALVYACMNASSMHEQSKMVGLSCSEE